MAWKRDALVWYVAPTYRQVKQIAWRELKRLARPWTVGKPNESDLSIQLAWGAQIALRGADNYDSLRGPGLDGLVCDEFGDMAHEAWTEVLRPMLSVSEGPASFIGTPKGFNHFKDLYDNALVTPGWAAYKFTTLQGGNVSREEIEDAKRDLDEKTFRQEYEASFESTASGRVYYAFDRVANMGPVEFDPKWPLFWSTDFNIDPMASVLGQLIETTTSREANAGKRSYRVNVLDEIVLPDTRTVQALPVVLKRIRQLGEVRKLLIYGDASGSSGHSSSLKNDWEHIKDFFRGVSDLQVEYRVPSKNPFVRERVNAVNAMICNAAGERRMTLSPKCKELAKDFDEVVWKRDAAGNPLDDISKADKRRTHVSDALGYQVWKETGLRERGGARSQIIV